MLHADKINFKYPITLRSSLSLNCFEGNTLTPLRIINYVIIVLTQNYLPIESKSLRITCANVLPMGVSSGIEIISRSV